MIKYRLVALGHWFMLVAFMVFIWPIFVIVYGIKAMAAMVRSPLVAINDYLNLMIYLTNGYQAFTLRQELLGHMVTFLFTSCVVTIAYALFGGDHIVAIFIVSFIILVGLDMLDYRDIEPKFFVDPIIR